MTKEELIKIPKMRELVDVLLKQVEKHTDKCACYLCTITAPWKEILDKGEKND